MLREERPAVVTLDVALGPPAAPPKKVSMLLDEIVEQLPAHQGDHGDRQ